MKILNIEKIRDSVHFLIKSPMITDCNNVFIESDILIDSVYNVSRSPIHSMIISMIRVSIQNSYYF